MVNMTKEIFIREMATRGNIKKIESEKYYDLFLETFKHGIKEYGCIKFMGIGSFRMKEYKEKIARNIHTGEKVIVPKRKKVKFTMSETFWK